MNAAVFSAHDFNVVNDQEMALLENVNRPQGKCLRLTILQTHILKQQIETKS